MSDISPLGNSHAAHNRINADRPNASNPAATRADANGSDTVEVSTNARLLSLLDQVPDVRRDLVDRVKIEIESGVYDEDRKLDAALDQLIAEEL